MTFRLEDIVDLVDAMHPDIAPACIDVAAKYAALRYSGADRNEALTMCETDMAEEIARGDDVGYCYECIRAGIREFARTIDAADG